MFAEALRDNRLLTFGDWLGSDRPPLLSGFVLLFKVPGVPIDQSYLFLGTIVQLLVVPVMVCVIMLSTIDKPERLRLVLIGALIMFMVASPLFLHNASFLWPKVLSASFLLCAVYLMFLEPARTGLIAVISGMLLALAFLSHGGSAFALIPLILFYLICNPSLPGLLYGGIKIGVFFVLYLPWMAYQNVIQPPGDRLLKWHLLDQVSVTERSFVEIAVDRYRDIGMDDILERLLRSLEVQFVSPYRTLFGQVPPVDLTRSFVNDSFFFTAAALGLVTLPLMVALVMTTRSRAAIVVFLIWILCVSAWSLLPFRGAMSIHEGSYIIQVLPWLVIALCLIALKSAWIKAAVLAILLVQTLFQLKVFWEVRWDRIFPSTEGLGRLISISGYIGGGDFASIPRPGARIIGTYAGGGDADIAEIVLVLQDARAIRYITGPDPTGQRLLVRSGGETLLEVESTVFNEWSRLEFAATNQVAIILIDEGSGWGQWSAIEVLE